MPDKQHTQKYLNDMFGLEGCSAFITGAGGLLCGEMARGLASSGCKVVVGDRELKKAQDVVEGIRSFGGEAVPFEIDVNKKSHFVKALQFTLETYKSADILINGAGINAPTPLMDITEEEWDSILSVHLKGTLFGCQVFGEHMIRQKKGSIINISSASSGPPLSKAFTYSVAKAGIKNLTQNIAREWAPHGVRVNALRPGFFPTEWSKKNFITPDRHMAIMNHTPMKRYGEANELVGAVIWLSSKSSSFVTGSELVVDGGFTSMTI